MTATALLVAAIIGMSAPAVGTYLVQRRMSLLGDGIGHVALTGVALGWIAGAALDLAGRDSLAVPGAMVVAVLGAVTVESLQHRGSVATDVSMALMFYGGAAGGVLLFGAAGGTHEEFEDYLFGSLGEVTAAETWASAALAVAVVALALWLRPLLFAVAHDAEFARASGIPVRAIGLALSITAALTITLAMRVVGLLLVSGVMIVPVAIAQLVRRSFGATLGTAIAVGGAVSLGGAALGLGLGASEPGAVIIVLAVAIYAIVAGVAAARRRVAP